MNKEKTNPIVLANAEWTPPDWLLEEVKAEREIIALCAALRSEQFKSEADYVGDAECLAYMMPATMVAPMDYDYAEIYLYLATKVMKQAKRVEVPEDIRVERLDDYKMGLLKELKSRIFRRRNGKVKSPIVEALNEAFRRSKAEGKAEQLELV